MKVSTKGHYALDTYKAVLADGGSREQALSEVNRLLFPIDWNAALSRGEVVQWVRPC